ncbi:MAG: hypothetical protein JNN06_04265, partial [Gemmobacter sp.]|uniref:hypothetical protein n=1 Tax=Gemmobacter sp. TaxID=1898957 RepID=UPI001A3BAF19
FALAAVFLGGVLWLDIAGLRGLIFGSSMGLVAAAMLWVFNGVVFAGVQFAIAVMKLAEADDGPRGGTRAPAARPGDLQPVRIRSAR